MNPNVGCPTELIIRWSMLIPYLRSLNLPIVYDIFLCDIEPAAIPPQAVVVPPQGAPPQEAPQGAVVGGPYAAPVPVVMGQPEAPVVIPSQNARSGSLAISSEDWS